MAYAYESNDEFNKINGALGGQKESIFAESPGANQALGPQGTQEGVKTTAAGGSSGGSSAPGEQAAGQQAVGGGASQSSAIMEASKSAQAPKAATQAQSSLAGQQQKLADDSTKYATDTAAKNTYGVSSADIGSAVKGDQKAGENLSGLMTGKAKAVDPFKAEGYQGGAADVILADKSPSDTAGLERLIRQEGPATLTSGGARLDAQILGQNQEFQRIKQALNAQRGQLQNDLVASGTKNTTAAQTAADTNYGAAQEAARLGLAERRRQLIADNELQATQGFRTMEAGVNQTPEGKAKAVRDALATLSGDSPELQGYYNNIISGRPERQGHIAGINDADYGATAAFDPTEFYQNTSNLNGANPNWENFVDAGEAGEFGRIGSFLGEGGSIQGAAVGKGLGQNTGYDIKAIADAIRAGGLKGQTSGRADADNQKAVAAAIADANAARGGNQMPGGSTSGPPPPSGGTSEPGGLINTLLSGGQAQGEEWKKNIANNNPFRKSW